MGVLGAKPLLLGITAATLFVALVGPFKPFFVFNVNVDGEERPTLPLPLPLLVMFVVNAAINFFCVW